MKLLSRLALKIVVMTREQGTGNREQGTGNREQVLGNFTFRYLCRFFSLDTDEDISEFKFILSFNNTGIMILIITSYSLTEITQMCS